jgi:two-component system chemotaxis sensor kinase CheA
MSDGNAEFVELFRDEATERLDSMVDSLLAVESGAAKADAVDSLFRDAHTIKGAAGMLGFAPVHTLAHAVEDVLSSVRDQGTFPTELVEPLLRATDALRTQITGKEPPTDDLVEELAEHRAMLLTGNGAAEQRPDNGAQAGTERKTLRVPAEKIDRLLDLVGEVRLYRRRLEHTLSEQVEPDAVTDQLDAGDKLLDDLKDTAIGMRTLPLASIVGALPRAVRDLSLAEGKDVELVVLGSETELDRVILESLSDPLVHLVRNAIVHGIESPAERKAAKKPSRGRIELRAEQRGSQVEIVVADDGRGVSQGALEQARREGSLVDVLAQAGYSTAEEVTGLAGRGVGLDAVRSYAHTYAGSLEVRSEPGRGTEVVLTLPLALALVEVLLVERGANVYGVPLGSVEEVVTVDDTLLLGGRASLELRGRSLRLFDLAALVGAAAQPLPEKPPALVVTSGERRVAAACDALLGEQEVVVKPLGPLLAHLEGYLGAAILGDGRVALLLDAPSLTRGPRRVSPVATPAAPAPAPGVTPKVLVVEDSFTVRELQRSILEAAGYRVVTARDGRDALDVLARDEDIALVLTDLEMPEVDGFELTRAIRADAGRSTLPVVVVTSLASEEDRRRGVEAGADAYMVKRSFDQQALLETVERLVGR